MDAQRAREILGEERVNRLLAAANGLTRAEVDEVIEVVRDAAKEIDATGCGHSLTQHMYALGSETKCSTCGAVLRLYECGPQIGQMPPHEDARRMNEYPFPACPTGNYL